MKKILVIGMDFGLGHSIGSQLVIEANRQIAISCRKQEEIKLGIPQYTNEELALKNLGYEAKTLSEAINELSEAFNSLVKVSFDPITSKFFGAPKHNYKRR